MLETGSIAPEFTLSNQEANPSLYPLIEGKKVVLYFYPKDDTPGCTKQACSFAEYYPSFMEKNAVVIGISKDSSKSHKKFAQKFQLPFTLLADPELDAITKYDVWKEKNMYGKIVMGVVRTTYLIDEEGVIVKALGKVDAEKNAEQMLEIIS